MRSSIAAGFIAGAIAGMIPFTINHIYGALRFLGWSPYPSDIPFLVSQLTVHIGFNAMWGAFFGLFIGTIFDRIPGKTIIKGILIGLVYCLFSILQPAYSFWAYGHFIWTVIFLVNGPQDKFVYGVLFAYLYKKVI